MPLSTTRVIPPNWSKHHRSVPRGAANCKVRITRPQLLESEFNPDTGSVDIPDPVVIYDGPARIQQQRTNQANAVAGEQAMPIAPYLVVIDYDAEPVRVGDTGDDVVPYDCINDTQLNGRKLRVQRATFGSERWERDLWCSEDQAQNNTGKVVNNAD